MGSEPIIGSEGKRKWGEKCNSASGDTFRDLELVELWLHHWSLIPFYHGVFRDKFMIPPLYV